MLLRDQIRRLPTLLLRSRLPTNHMERPIFNRLQICMVMFRLLPSRPANRPKEKYLPTDIQIWLVMTPLYLNRYLAGRHRLRLEDTAHLQWILTLTPTFLIALQWTFLLKREKFQIRILMLRLPTPTRPCQRSRIIGRP